MQFWADILLHHPELVPEVPKDATAMLWGYEADHPFEQETRTLADAGLPFYVCPGTSSGQSIGGRIDREAYTKGQQAVVRVKDNGIGIPIDDIPRIWDRLYRGDKSRSQRGLGLGLSLVKAVVQAHHGQVEAAPNPSGGSLFSVYLPLLPAA